jgi:hypothetical protein
VLPDYSPKPPVTACRVLPAVLPVLVPLCWLLLVLVLVL